MAVQGFSWKGQSQTCDSRRSTKFQCITFESYMLNVVLHLIAPCRALTLRSRKGRRSPAQSNCNLAGTEGLLLPCWGLAPPPIKKFIRESPSHTAPVMDLTSTISLSLSQLVPHQQRLLNQSCALKLRARGPGSLANQV